MEDFEKGRAAEIRPDGFLTDDTISTGSWCFTDNLGIKSSDTVIDSFIDLVAKNGCLLLNISPKADGTIPEDQRKVLLDIGAWLEVNGEAVFETRPWEIFGEGPTRLKKGGHFIKMKGPYTPEDIRYTRSKDGKTLYAIVLGTPEGKIALKSVKIENANGTVELLGHGKVPFTVKEGKITIECPKEWPTNWAHALELSGFDFSLDKEAAEEALAALPGAKARLSKDLTLAANEAGLKGNKLRLEGPDGDENIGYWDNLHEHAQWKVAIPKPGEYKVSAQIACPGTSKLVVITDENQMLTAPIPNTGSYQAKKTIELGTLRFTKAGVHTVIAAPADKKTWRAINLWKLVLE